MRSVRRISLGITTRPSSSMRLTIPVAFIFLNPPDQFEVSVGSMDFEEDFIHSAVGKSWNEGQNFPRLPFDKRGEDKASA